MCGISTDLVGFIVISEGGNDKRSAAFCVNLGVSVSECGFKRKKAADPGFSRHPPSVHCFFLKA